MEKEQSGVENQKCVVCNGSCEGRVLLKGVKDHKDVWVCTRCLPVLIHGQH